MQFSIIVQEFNFRLQELRERKIFSLLNILEEKYLELGSHSTTMYKLNNNN